MPKPKTTQPRSCYSSKKEYWHCSWTWETNFLLTKGTKGAELFNELGYCCLNSISPQKKVVVSFSLQATMRSSPFWSLIWITISHSCFIKISFPIEFALYDTINNYILAKIDKHSYRIPTWNEYSISKYKNIYNIKPRLQKVSMNSIMAIRHLND